MGRIVLAMYRPRAGAEAKLLGLVRDHVPALRREGLATERAPLVIRASDGTIIEIFEWKSEQAAEDAHSNDAIRKLWSRFEEACEFGTLEDLPGASHPFPHFDPVDL